MLIMIINDIDEKYIDTDNNVMIMIAIMTTITIVMTIMIMMMIMISIMITGKLQENYKRTTKCKAAEMCIWSEF